uniref:Uncharacterized protein n=1 Tax=Mus musculus TaxID=10090 RepID=Q3UUH9_MOUSE|nr:unnamed protein product [Mus musculus]
MKGGRVPERWPCSPEVEVRGTNEVQEVGRWLLGLTIRPERFRELRRRQGDELWGGKICTPWVPGLSCSAEWNTKRGCLEAELHLSQAIDRRSSERDRQTVTGKMNCHLPFFRGTAG